MQHRFQLDGSNHERKQKIDCPYCGSKKSFTRYKDYETGAYLDDNIGMCDRANKCGIHVKPKEYFSQHPDKRTILNITDTCLHENPKELVHIPADYLTATLKDYKNNSFIMALSQLFSKDKIEQAISNYYIGTVQAGFKAENDHGLSTIFWFIDKNNNIRAGQVKLFDNQCKTAKYINDEGGKRNYQTWIHSVLKKQFQAKSIDLPQWLKDYTAGEKVTCLFGEHLLRRYPNKPVALVESPKSAFIASMCYPDFIWLATSSLTYLIKERCKVLKDRRVVLFPDCGIPNPKTGKTCLMQWQERINEFSFLSVFSFSTLLEENATPQEKESGFDIADLLLRELSQQQVIIRSKDIVSIPCETRTGNDFGNLILATAWLKDGNRYDILFDKNGELITVHEKIQPLAHFFEKSFIPGKLDGKDCLINIINN